MIAFVRRQSLFGEVLSHASYPGIVLALLLVNYILPFQEESWWIVVLIGAFLSSLIGAYLLKVIEEKFKVNNDAALCLVLSSFLGMGVLVASRVQVVSPRAMKEVSIFLCGQAATMTDQHVYVYALLALLIALFITIFFRQIQAVSFDPDFSKLKGYSLSWINRSIMILFALAVVMGVQGVGVVLMAGMLIAPAITARFLTNRLGLMFPIAALVGAFSGFFGNVLSVSLSYKAHIALPTGPMILGVASFITFMTCLVSPKKGLIIRCSRLLAFRFRCLRENILKFLWKKKSASFADMQRAHHISPIALFCILELLKWEKCIDNGYTLLPKGKEQAEYIVRLHRLWEVYLYRYLGIAGEKVHVEAEQMEHVITKEIEEELTMLLDNPSLDPHNQPIPQKKGDI